MAKYLSNRQQNLKIGIVSYTENKTVLEVTGKVGIGTTNATSKLWVNGDGYFTGILTANRIFSSQYGEFVGGSISGTSLVGTSLSISGISTLDVTSATSIVVGSGVTINASGINASGIATASQLSTGASGTGINITTNTISGPATLTIDPAAVGDNTGLVVIKGDLQIDGTTTTINSTTVTVDDKNIVLGSGAINDAAADGSGITIESGNGNKTFQFEDTGDNLGSSENINVISGKVYKINNTSVLSSTTLGSGVINSSLTSVGTLTNLNVGNVYSSGIVTATTFVGALTGTATSTTNIPNLTGAITSNNTTTSLGSFTSSQLEAALTDETGSGSAVFATSPVLVTPSLGIATATKLTTQQLNVSGIATLGTVQISSGIITATTGIVTYYGDGSKLTGIAASSIVGVTTYATSAGIATYATNAGIATYATNAGIATNLKGGVVGNIPYQSATDTTVFLTNGGSGTILQSNGVGNAPTWVAAAPASAISGLTIRDEGTVVGGANSISQLNFVGTIVSVASTAGIATITFLDYVSNAGVSTYATNAGVSTNVIGGIGSITQLQVTGVSTFTNGPILVGTATSTGTASQTLQVTGGAYVSDKIGIGTTNPTSTLQVSGNTLIVGIATANTFRARGGSPGAFGANNNGYGFFGSGDHDSGMYSSADGQIEFYSNSSESARITTNRNLLIGTITETGTASQTLQVTGGAYVSDKIGIGTTNPSWALDVNGIGRFTNSFADVRLLNNYSGSAQGYRFALDGGSPNNLYLQRSTNNFSSSSNILVVDSSGNLIVNNTTSTGTSSQPLQVTGGAYVSGSVGIGTTNPGATLNVVPTATSIAGLFSGTTSSDMVLITQLGTGNALVVEDSANPDSSPFVVKGDGSVGIGTNNPTVSLQLSPDANISNLNVSNNFGTTAGAAATVAQFYHSNGNASRLRIKATRNTAGADWTTASTKLLQVTDVTEQGYIEYNPNGSLSGMAFGQGETEWARFLSGGNLGVGNTNPTSKLHVVGDGRFTGVVTATTFVGALTGTASNVTTNANLTGDVTSVGNATAIAAGVIVDADINASAGIVDTKLATISTALKVSNSATTATNANTASAIVARDASGNFSAGTITASLTGNAATATNVAYGGLTGAVPTWNQNTTGSAGSVDFNNLTSKASGSGTYTTSGNFIAPIFYDYNNTAYYTDPASTSNLNSVTAVDFNSTSDIKLKTNVTQISNSIEKISQLNGVSFNWKNTNKPSLGVIAQEVEKVFPELVNDSETKTVNYNGLIGVLIEAIKEQQIQINDLKNMIINNKE